MTESAVIFKTRNDARVAPAAPLPPAAPRRRKPPVPGDDSEAGLSRPSPPASSPEREFVDRSHHPIVASALASVSVETLQVPATIGDTFETLDVALQNDDRLHSHIVALRSQVSDLKAALVEARHEVRELKLIQESLRISTRGESGRDGARGVPGRDGRDGVGLAGPRGERGERGKPAPVIAAWEPNPERFAIVPRYSNGECGPPISLLALFQAYHAATEWLEDADLEQAAQASRQAAEEEAERSRWAVSGAT